MDKQSKSGGISVLGLLGVAFVVLKLTSVIDWSWWWVTAPFWGLFAIVAVIWVVLIVVAGVATVIEWSSERRKSDGK